MKYSPETRKNLNRNKLTIGGLRKQEDKTTMTAGMFLKQTFHYSQSSVYSHMKTHPGNTQGHNINVRQIHVAISVLCTTVMLNYVRYSIIYRLQLLLLLDVR